MLISKGRLKIFAEETQKAEDFLSSNSSPLLPNTSSASDEAAKVDKLDSTRPPLPAKIFI
jgi:hypothetical protein